MQIKITIITIYKEYCITLSSFLSQKFFLSTIEKEIKVKKYQKCLVPTYL